jgi:hypothetical protein
MIARAADRPDTGSAAAELVVLTPLMIVFTLALLLGGRLGMAALQVGDATRTSIEAAVVEPTPDRAQIAAAVAAYSELRSDGLVCHPYAAAAGTASFRPGGLVTMQISCGVALETFGLPGLPGRAVLASSALAAIEPYREVG